MDYYWPNMYRECEEYVKQRHKCQTHQKRQRVVKHIWTTRWFQRYQADTIGRDKSLTEKGKFIYILTVIDHFSKYAWIYPLVSKHD